MKTLERLDRCKAAKMIRSRPYGNLCRVYGRLVHYCSDCAFEVTREERVTERKERIERRIES